MENRKVFEGSVTPISTGDGVTPSGLIVQAAGDEYNDEIMQLVFSLELSDDKYDELQKKVGSGEVLTPQQINANYGVGKADADALSDWLKGQGFEITKISGNNMSIYARASVSQIAKSLQVDMVRVTRDGLTYTAARNAPSLPWDVGKDVHAIIGLQPFRQAKKHFRMHVPKNPERSQSAGTNAEGTMTPQIQNAPPYFASEIRKAYNADSTGLKGKGQTIAILIDTFPNSDDLISFWANNNLSTSIDQVQMINVTGQALPMPEGEETLDAEWTSGIAPDANIRIYASGSLQFTDLDRALDRIFDDLSEEPSMRQLSISLGLGETYMGGPDGEVATQHQKFLKLAAAGVNIFVSTGDAGSNPDQTGHSSNGPLQAEHPSTDTNVIAVGGTSLVLSSNGGVSNESGWSSSGGNKSIYFRRQPWQKGNTIPAGTTRLVPDVSAPADPEHGAYLFFQGKIGQIGGTSWSAPVWAGFCALINESRVKSGKQPLPYLNPLLYPLLGTAHFRDITNGSNGAYRAKVGYDMVTGIGVPDVAELVKTLG
jgi:kumamolisin